MAAHRIGTEWAARILVLIFAVGLPGMGLASRWLGDRKVVHLVAAMPEAGGWQPGNLTIPAGEPLHLRLTSDDVVHGFAIGHSDRPPVDVRPGKVTDLVLNFGRAGTYTYYCTRWCGPNHWRMRGTIEVTGSHSALESLSPALYMTLGIDLDASHPVDAQPQRVPSAARGASLGVSIPGEYVARDYVRSHSPLEVWLALRDDQTMRTGALSDTDVWDIVALIWRLNTTSETVEMGRLLYAENCAACHGVAGAGDGVMAGVTVDREAFEDGADAALQFGHEILEPADLTSADLLGASPALLQGKVLRGGMGTGMPYWGPIFTDRQTWALVDYLWTFHFLYKWRWQNE